MPLFVSIVRVWCTYFGNEAGAYSENEENAAYDRRRGDANALLVARRYTSR